MGIILLHAANSACLQYYISCDKTIKLVLLWPTNEACSGYCFVITLNADVSGTRLPKSKRSGSSWKGCQKQKPLEAPLQICLGFKVVPITATRVTCVWWTRWIQNFRDRKWKGRMNHSLLLAWLSVLCIFIFKRASVSINATSKVQLQCCKPPQRNLLKNCTPDREKDWCRSLPAQWTFEEARLLHTRLFDT